MKNKKTKGQYGYREYHKKIQVYKILFGAFMIVAQLLARELTDNQSAKNILTVMAILSVLPTANVASPLLASWKYKTPPIDFYRMMNVHETEYHIMYDLIITSKEFIMPMDAVIVHPLGVYLYCTSPKVNAAKAEAFLNDMFIEHKLDPHAKVFLDEKGWKKRMDSLKPASEFTEDGSVEYTVNLLKNLSM